MNMIKSRLVLNVTLLVVALTVAGCANVSSANDAEQVATAYREALNAGDIETAMTYVDENITVTDLAGKFSGKDLVRDHQKLIYGPGNAMLEMTDIHVEGDHVNYRYHLLIDGETAAMDDGLIVVQDGKIVFDGYLGSWTLECRINSAQVFCAED